MNIDFRNVGNRRPWLAELNQFFSDLDNSGVARSMADDSHREVMIIDILNKYKVPVFRYGTNRMVVKEIINGTPVVYLIAYRSIGVDDNINEEENSKVATRYPEIQRYLSLNVWGSALEIGSMVNTPNGQKKWRSLYPDIIMQHYVIPVHELNGIKNPMSKEMEGDESLRFIVDNIGMYTEALNILGRYFILHDVWLKSPFQWGVNFSPDKRLSNLVLLDHGYLYPKVNVGDIKCPSCGEGVINYKPALISQQNFEADKAGIKILTSEKYTCSNKTCRLSGNGISPAKLIESISTKARL